MQTPRHIQDLSAQEIAELLEKQGRKVPASLIPELKLFIDEIYRIQTTNAAFEMLSELEAAA